MSNLYIFGYGSLVSSGGINGRNMRRLYKETDITECTLRNYSRALNAVFRGYDYEREMEIVARFFGISPAPGQSVNGIVFPLDKRDIDPFIRSEGGYQVYDFRRIDVNDLTFDYDQRSPIKRDDKVFACVVKRPSRDGHVSQDYIKRCQRALDQRSDRFKEVFGPLDSYLP